jgi:hypothetical protein
VRESVKLVFKLVPNLWVVNGNGDALSTEVMSKEVLTTQETGLGKDRKAERKQIFDEASLSRVMGNVDYSRP